MCFSLISSSYSTRTGISLRTRGAEGPPDFVVEILSPKTRTLDLENKKRTYARLGVNELWIIDPVPCELSSVRIRAGPRESNPAVRCQRESGRRRFCQGWLSNLVEVLFDSSQQHLCKPAIGGDLKPRFQGFYFPLFSHVYSLRGISIRVATYVEKEWNQ